MANADIKKFQELLATDAGFQAKFNEAAEAYNGSQDVKDDGINASAAVASIVLNDAMAGIHCQGIGFHD